MPSGTSPTASPTRLHTVTKAAKIRGVSRGKIYSLQKRTYRFRDDPHAGTSRCGRGHSPLEKSNPVPLALIFKSLLPMRYRVLAARHRPAKPERWISKKL
jgi:hypothetical protein